MIRGFAPTNWLKEAQVTFFLTDNETTEQLAASTGSVKVTDLGVGRWVLGKLGGAAGAGWSKSNEGKVIAAAFLDAHNKSKWCALVVEPCCLMSAFTLSA